MPYINAFIPNLINDLFIFIVGLASVYTVGKMFMLTESYRLKNSIAFIVMTLLSYFLYFKEPINFIMIFNAIVHLSICILLYVLIGFTLYDRMDSFFDKTIGKDLKRKIKK